MTSYVRNCSEEPTERDAALGAVICEGLCKLLVHNHLWQASTNNAGLEDGEVLKVRHRNYVDILKLLGESEQLSVLNIVLRPLGQPMQDQHVMVSGWWDRPCELQQRAI